MPQPLEGPETLRDEANPVEFGVAHQLLVASHKPVCNANRDIARAEAEAFERYGLTETQGFGMNSCS